MLKNCEAILTSMSGRGRPESNETRDQLWRVLQDDTIGTSKENEDPLKIERPLGKLSKPRASAKISLSS
jgi:hypothetical protein